MLFEHGANTGLYQKAIDQFMIDVNFYFGEIQTYFIDLTTEQRILALCAVILFVIYIIFARARRKYNPGSLGRQFATAVLVLGVIVIGGNILLGQGAGAYSHIFQL